MVVVFSIESDTSTHEVLDWLNYFGCSFLLVYPSTISAKAVQIIELLDKGALPSFWFRKWDKITPVAYGSEFSNSIACESIKLIEYIYHRTKDRCYWLNAPSDYNNNNKLIQQSIAQKVGLLVPDSFVVDSKVVLNRILKDENRGFITKSFGTQIVTNVDGIGHFSFTKYIDEDFVSTCSDSFFPSLVQVCIDKQYEIRAFYLDGDFYSMAIFSQTSEKTRLDFRHYDTVRPNRMEPIKLPFSIEDVARSFANQLSANCGSFDFIVSKEGKIYFLEFNHLGQFGMVSKPCNYNIEMKIAKLLIARVNGCIEDCCPPLILSKCVEKNGLALCMIDLERIENSGINMCYFSKFYESRYAVVKSLSKPIDLM